MGKSEAIIYLEECVSNCYECLRDRIDTDLGVLTRSLYTFEEIINSYSEVEKTKNSYVKYLYWIKTLIKVFEIQQPTIEILQYFITAISHISEINKKSEKCTKKRSKLHRRKLDQTDPHKLHKIQKREKHLDWVLWCASIVKVETDLLTYFYLQQLYKSFKESVFLPEVINYYLIFNECCTQGYDGAERFRYIAENKLKDILLTECYEKRYAKQKYELVRFLSHSAGLNNLENIKRVIALAYQSIHAFEAIEEDSDALTIPELITPKIEKILLKNNFLELETKYDIQKDTIHSNTKNMSCHIHVRKATERNTGEAVAIKELIVPRDKENKYKEEINFIKRLSGKSAVFLKYYGVVKTQEKDGRLSLKLIMEWCPRNLKQDIEKRKRTNDRYSEKLLKEIVTTLLDGFCYLEKEGIYHNDIKPQNILLTHSDALKIADFNLSKQIDTAQTNVSNFYGILGTECYMPPEIYKAYILRKNGTGGSTAKYKIGISDVFSLGITFYELYSLENIAFLNTEERKGYLFNKLEEIRFEWLKEILKKMLAYDYHDRCSFQQARELLNESS